MLFQKKHLQILLSFIYSILINLQNNFWDMEIKNKLYFSDLAAPQGHHVPHCKRMHIEARQTAKHGILNGMGDELESLMYW